MPEQNNETNNEQKLKCPRCSESDYSVEHRGGPTHTFILCHNCGYEGVKEAWEIQQMDEFMTDPMVSLAQSVGGNNTKASDKPLPENDPTILNGRNRDKKYRTKPEDRLKPQDVENVRNPGSPGTAMTNPFLKQAQLYNLGDEMDREQKAREQIRKEIDNYIQASPVYRDSKVFYYLEVDEQLAEEVWARIDNGANFQARKSVIAQVVREYYEQRTRQSMSNPFLKQAEFIDEHYIDFELQNLGLNYQEVAEYIKRFSGQTYGDQNENIIPKIVKKTLEDNDFQDRNGFLQTLVQIIHK